MNTCPSLGLLLLLPLAACNTGFDPHHLDLLRYEMELADVEHTLKRAEDTAEFQPFVRVFAPDTDGTPREWLLVHARSQYPHPPYSFVYTDRRLTAVTIGWNIPDRNAAWDNEQLRAWLVAAQAQRLPLQWSEVAPRDAAVPPDRPSPGGEVFEALTLGLPGLVLAPIFYPLSLLMAGDLDEQGRNLLAAAMAMPATATGADVEGQLGAAEARHEFHFAGSQWLVLDYQCRHWGVIGRGARIALRDGHLQWIRLTSVLPQFSPPESSEPAAR